MDFGSGAHRANVATEAAVNSALPASPQQPAGVRSALAPASAEAIVAAIRIALPEVLAIYAFGSRARGVAGVDSDLDLAVLMPGYAEPLALWTLAEKLADIAGCAVDLLDMRAASTVMQHQIVQTGQRLWGLAPAIGLFECFVLSEKTALDTARAGLLADIMQRGQVYGGDVLINKAASIERAVRRAREEYAAAGASFGADCTRQDAAVLNIQRACEAALDMGQHLIRRGRLGVPQRARDVFTLLAQASWIEADLAELLRRMVGYRNIAVHEYQRLLLPITVSAITLHLGDFLRFSSALLKRDAGRT